MRKDRDKREKQREGKQKEGREKGKSNKGGRTELILIDINFHKSIRKRKRLFKLRVRERLTKNRDKK